MDGKELRRMAAVACAIERVIQMPEKKFTKAEAILVLQKCGILSQKEDVEEAYKDIVVKTGDNKKES